MDKPSLPEEYTDIGQLEHLLTQKPEDFWRQRGEAQVLRLFHEMAKRVPAYKDFLRVHNCSPDQIREAADLRQVPLIDKDNYLRKYPRRMLCWDGEFPQGQWNISTTSGSTGQPYYFPRQKLQDQQYAVTAELYLRSQFSIHERSTLYIVAFPMGAWIGGLFTYEALKMVADKGYNLSIITPGIHKQEVINAVKQLGKDFDQIIIGAYAPFLKDILDDGVRAGIDWKQHKLGFVFSAEAFSEKFRDYVLQTVAADNPFTATLNHYGTVDLGTMAHETPEAIFMRRYLSQQNMLNVLFPEENRQPTFAQYNPELFYFETQDNSLVCSAFSGLPLVRYNLKDYGGILTKAEVYEKLAARGIDINEELARAGLKDACWNLPFVYVYERNDFSVSYYAFLIYPDTIRRALQSDRLNRLVTGKFTMQADYDAEGRQRLHVHVETKHGVEQIPELSAEVQRALHETLVQESSEYRETSRMIGDDAQPIIYLWDYEDPTHFRAGTKQKWVIKDQGAKQ